MAGQQETRRLMKEGLPQRKASLISKKRAKKACSRRWGFSALIINASNREQLGLMLLSKIELLRKLIEDGLSDNTKPRDRLAIFLKLNDLIQPMTQTNRLMTN